LREIAPASRRQRTQNQRRAAPFGTGKPAPEGKLGRQWL